MKQCDDQDKALIGLRGKGLVSINWKIHCFREDIMKIKPSIKEILLSNKGRANIDY
jgi:hypothetical protein